MGSSGPSVTDVVSSGSCVVCAVVVVVVVVVVLSEVSARELSVTLSPTADEESCPHEASEILIIVIAVRIANARFISFFPFGLSF